MGPSIRVNGKMTNWKVMASLPGKMVHNILGNGKTDKCTVWANTNGQTNQVTGVTFTKINNMESALFFGRTVEHILENGKTV